MTPESTQKIALGLIVLIILLGTALIFSEVFQDGFEALTVFIYEQQRGFSRRLSDSVAALRQSSEGSTWTLVSLGFVYGIFHAVGPGHGKAVISAYALTHETRFRRTVGLSFAAALIQGFSAIILVSLLSALVDGSIRRFALSADDILDPISYASVTAIGVYLLVRGLRAYKRAHIPGHAHHHKHDQSCGCGHNHAPTPNQVNEASNLWRAAVIALAVGIRPCSGAVLVLVLSFAFGFVFSGIAAVMAMALGTALTVSALAVGAQSLRWPLRHLVSTWGGHGDLLGAGMMLVGGLLISCVGMILLIDTLQAPSHPFF